MRYKKRSRGYGSYKKRRSGKSKNRSLNKYRVSRGGIRL